MKLLNPLRWWWQKWMWGWPSRIRGLVYWFPVIWHDEWIDWSYLLIVMRHKFAEMEENYPNGHCVGRERVACQAKTCRVLIDRLIEDDYFSTEPRFFFESLDNKRRAEHARYQQQQDLNYLCDIMRKHLFEWWD